jgi:hypothetical protein
MTSDDVMPLTLIFVHTLWSIPLVILGPGVEWTVDRNLQVITAQAVPVGVGVGEQTSLSTKYNIEMSKNGHHFEQFTTENTKAEQYGERKPHRQYHILSIKECAAIYKPTFIPGTHFNNCNILLGLVSNLQIDTYMYMYTYLQHFVGAGLYSWDQVSRGKGDLFHFSEVVLWISVQDHSTDRN